MQPVILKPYIPGPVGYSELLDAQQKAAAQGASGVSFSGSKSWTPEQVAQFIDSTKLTYSAGEDPDAAVKALCKEAAENRFYAVCVRPDKVTLAKTALSGTPVKVATVIGFPQQKFRLDEQQRFATIGDVSLTEKQGEAAQAIRDGADELDVVLNVRQFLQEVQQPEPVATLNELTSLKSIAGKVPVKVILETDLLEPEQVRLATAVCIKAGVDMVKTSTGMLDGGTGATVPTVTVMREALQEAGVFGKMGIKASGGIRDLKGAKALLDAGATRLGTSQGVAIIKGFATGDAY